MFPAGRFTEETSLGLFAPVRLLGDGSQSVRLTYFQWTQAPWFAEVAEQATREDYAYRGMFSAGHDTMLTQPDELAKMLLELV